MTRPTNLALAGHNSTELLEEVIVRMEIGREALHDQGYLTDIGAEAFDACLRSLQDVQNALLGVD